MEKNLGSFYYNLLNINKRDFDIEQILSQVINKQKGELLKQTDDISGFCKYLSYNIGEELDNRNINVSYLNINDILNINYNHYFLIAYNQIENQINYYLIDPTYEQFLKKENYLLNPKFDTWPSQKLVLNNDGKRILKSLLENGYCKINDQDIKLYLSSFTNKSFQFDLDTVIINNRRPKK